MKDKLAPYRTDGRMDIRTDIWDPLY